MSVYQFYVSKAGAEIRDITITNVLRKGAKPGVQKVAGRELYRVQVEADSLNMAWTEVVKVGIKL